LTFNPLPTVFHARKAPKEKSGLKDLPAKANPKGGLIASGLIASRLSIGGPRCDHITALTALTDCLRAGDAEGACRAFEIALDINPENLAARLNLAVAFEHSGSRARAKQAYTLSAEASDSAHAWQCGLAEHLPAIHRQQPKRPRPLGAAGVVNLIGHMAGGGGRVWGWEDRERVVRFEKLSCRILRVPGDCFHLEHPFAGRTSAWNAPVAANRREYERIAALSSRKLRAEIGCWPHVASARSRLL